MESVRNRCLRYLGAITLLILAWSLPAECQPARQGSAPNSAAYAAPNPPLPIEQVVKRLQEKNAERAAALAQYKATRVYRMRYRGFPSDRDAEMVVTMAYHAPNSKDFSIVSQTGSKFIIEHVFKKLIEGELEAANEENRRHTALTAENYDFTLAGYEAAPEGGRYVLNLAPKTKNKFLYRGKIWVDANDFAVVRIKVEPGKNPSFWIKSTEIEHTYIKVGEFWLPSENRTESVLRLGGVAQLTIQYKDYQVLRTRSPQNSKDLPKP